MRLLCISFATFLMAGLSACNHDSKTSANTPANARFTKIEAAESGVTFVNEMQRFESDTLNAHTYDPMYNGAGVGIGDFDRDGRQDVFFAANNVSSRLYLNRSQPGTSQLKFDDVTDRAGVQTRKWCTGVSVADVNQDGWPDIYVCVAGPGVEKWEENRERYTNLLFINQGCKPGQVPTFREQAKAYGLDVAGMNTQAAFFDYDRDGDLDCYVLRNALERQGRNSIRPKKTDGSGPSTDVLYRNEGLVAVGSGSKQSSGGASRTGQLPTATAHCHFKNVSAAEGITTEGYGLGLTIADINRDGWPDIYCANDFVSNDLVWINQHQNGKHTGFRDEAAALFKHTSYNSMGVDIQDVNNDALPDVMVVDMLPESNERQKMMLIKTSWDYFRLARQQGYQDEYVRNTLQLNMGSPPAPKGGADAKTPPLGAGGHFSEVGQLAGVFRTDWSWAPLLQDYDLDGRKDLFVTNGYRRDITNLDYVMYLNEQFQGFGGGGIKDAGVRRETLQKLYDLPEAKLHNYLFRNTTGDPATPPQFADVSEAWGLGEATFSNGAAYSDFDNDGDLDLVINNMDDPAGLYRNETRQPGPTNAASDTLHALRLRLPADAYGLGATVLVTGQNGQTQAVEAHPVRGYMSSVDPTVLVGLGKQRSANVTIRWANGQEQRLGTLPADTLHMITYAPNSPAQSNPALPATPTLFTTTDAADIGLTFRHVEAAYNDFQDTPMLPQQYSRNSPAMAVGDVDGDGRADVFVGADPGQVRRVYLQKQPGRFTELVQGANDLEDMGCAFFDADGDGDQDLYVVSGGSGTAAGVRPDGDPAYQDRLYLNDGAGHFTRLQPGANPAPAGLPATRSSGGCVVVADFDKDGDLDLFRSGRVCVGAYPKAPANYLLRNDSPRRGGPPLFTDVTDQLAPGLRHVGMTCAALWTDPDRDGWPDLLLAGEFMPVTLFKNGAGKRLTATDCGLGTLPGLWSSLAGADLDGDGDTDYIAGNLGLNSRFKASAAEPLRIYGNDFDKNGKLDPVLTYYLQGKEHMASIRDALNEQMTTLSRKRFPTYQAYATTAFADLFKSDELDGAVKLEATELRSCWLENTGNGQLVPHPLPLAAQVSPVMGIQPTDVNRDGLLDLVLVGNSFATETYTGRYESSRGVLLLNQAKATNTNRFRAVPPTQTGLAIDGDAKAIATLPVGTTNWLLVTNADGPVQLIRPR